MTIREDIAQVQRTTKEHHGMPAEKTIVAEHPGLLRTAEGQQQLATLIIRKHGWARTLTAQTRADQLKARNFVARSGKKPPTVRIPKGKDIGKVRQYFAEIDSLVLGMIAPGIMNQLKDSTQVEARVQSALAAGGTKPMEVLKKWKEAHGNDASEIIRSELRAISSNPSEALKSLLNDAVWIAAFNNLAEDKRPERFWWAIDNPIDSYASHLNGGFGTAKSIILGFIESSQPVLPLTSGNLEPFIEFLNDHASIAFLLAHLNQTPLVTLDNRHQIATLLSYSPGSPDDRPEVRMDMEKLGEVLAAMERAHANVTKTAKFKAVNQGVTVHGCPALPTFLVPFHQLACREIKLVLKGFFERQGRV